MAKKISKDKILLARLVTDVEDRKPCAFCQREIDDEITYGKLYSIGRIQCHYFCVLLSCCLIQKGKDEEGLFGFLYPDILAELERSKKHRCSFCNREGATLGCSLSQCRKQFHLPCGRERNAVSLFYGNFKSFCVNHAPKQKVADDVMAKAKLRMKADRKRSTAVVTKVDENNVEYECSREDSLCVICYEEVQCYPSPLTFWPPCCARDKWFHRSCLQRMALSAGMHYLKCPLCNDKDSFYQAVISQGYYVPDRDAAWELEQNAFAEIYERELSCNLPECLCPLGRDHDSDNGPWDIKLCLLCGSMCAHAQCLVASGCAGPRYVCATCNPAAPEDLEQLAASVEKVVLASQTNNTRSGPVMPSRMSLRRTKQRQAYYRNTSSSSQTNLVTDSKSNIQEISDNLKSSRQELNLKTPKRFSKDPGDSVLRDIENTLLSPMKLIEQGFREKVKNIVGEGGNVDIEPSVLEKARNKFRKPKPWSEKKKIVDGILEDLEKDIIKQKKPKTKEPVREWFSPKKESENQVPQLETALPQMIQESPETITNDIPEISTHITNTETTLQPDATDDDDSTSTFELPPEFIADDTQTFDTPKKLKTVEIEKDSSMEISENNDIVNVNLFKIENSNGQQSPKSPVESEFAFTFDPKDEKSLEKNNVNIDLETFKSQYLSEVDRDFKCKFSHVHSDSRSPFKLQTAIDFALDAASKERKRKIKTKKKSGKRRRLEENEEKKSRKKKKNKKLRKKVRIVYTWKSNSPCLSPSKSEVHKSLKQYVLNYAVDNPGEIIGKPEKDVTPMKKKHFKNEKSPDNLIQTSIQSFFKAKPLKE